MEPEKTLEQLRAEALNPPAPVATTAAPVEQPRDDQGRFIAEEVVYEYEIDLGDGSGVQKFSAPTQEELIEKLGEAQRHATIKIREQAAELKKVPAKVEIAPLTEDEKFLYGQKIVSDPGAAIQELANRFIMPALEPRLAKAEKAERSIAQAEATQDFLQKHPDFYPTPANGKRILKQLELDGKDGTSTEHIEAAFKNLSESGLLEARPTEAPGAGTTAEHTEPERIAPAARESRVTVRKVASGLSGRRSAPAPPAGPTEDDLRKMPIDELRQRSVEALARG